MKVKSNIELLFKKNKLWPQIQSIVIRCHQLNFSAFIVGGAVRDAYIGKVPEDFDIATSAHPEELLKIFPKAHFVGKAFGVIYLPLNKKKGVEIATFRKEGPYLDGRRPSKVNFCSIEEDVQRRDFTINALYYDVKKKEIIDFVFGLKDLSKKKIRTVGPAEKRFKEDKLRMLRAVRLATSLDFSIEEQTFQTIIKMIPYIHQISKERICDELEKIFKKRSFSKAINIFTKINFLNILWPEWDWNEPSFPKIWNKDIKNNFKNVENLLFFYWSLIFFPPAIEFLHKNSFILLKKKLKISLVNISIPSKRIKQILNFYPFYQNILNKDVRLGQKLRLLNQKDGQIYFYLAFYIVSKNLKKSEDLKKIQKIYQKKILNGFPKPFLKGDDFLKAGMSPGPRISLLFENFYDEQLEGKIQNKKSALKKLKNIK